MGTDRKKTKSPGGEREAPGGSAFLSIYEKYERPLFNFLYRMSLDTGASEDMLQ